MVIYFDNRFDTNVIINIIFSFDKRFNASIIIDIEVYFNKKFDVKVVIYIVEFEIVKVFSKTIFLNIIIANS